MSIMKNSTTHTGLLSPRASSSSSITSLEPDPSPSPAACPCNTEILRDGVVITGSNCTVQVGDRITLKVQCGDCELTDFVWTIPGTIFNNYQASKGWARKTDVPDEDFEKQELYFYWTDAADGRVITCDFSAWNDGKKEKCHAEATLDVKRPTVNYTRVLGTYEKVQPANQAEMALRPEDGFRFGIEFTGDVQIQDGNGFSPGKWHFVQRLTINCGRRLYGTLDYQVPTQNTQTLLDTTYPFEPKPYDPDPGSPGYWDALVASNPQTVGDSPSDTLGGAYTDYNPPLLMAYTDAKFSLIFSTYIMYKPGTSNSRWVPLQKIEWGVDVCLYHSAGDGVDAWTYGSAYTDPVDRAYAGDAIDTTEHPLWEDFYVKGWVSSDPLDFCRPE